MLESEEVPWCTSSHSLHKTEASLKDMPVSLKALSPLKAVNVDVQIRLVVEALVEIHLDC